MKTVQISVTVPEQLFSAAKQKYEELGYRNMQEYFLELARRDVYWKKYAEIEKRMMQGKGVKKMSKEEAIKYVKSW